MEAQNGERIKVTLLWIQILDKLEPFFKEKGEFRFTARVSSRDRGGILRETRFPEEGHYEISDHPAWNKVKLNLVIFEGEIEEHLVVELLGEELDMLSANDHLDTYRREFSGPPSTWVGWYGPGDEAGGEPAHGKPGASSDPENLSNWRVCYEIERA